MIHRHPQQISALCTAFQHMATRTWHRMCNNHTTPILIREDGLTSLNLQDLYHLQSQEFSVIDFSPHIESNTTGADWEWWFMQPGRHFGAAVQAKALKPTHDYDIPYVPSNGYPQIRRLLDYSRNSGLTPMYCFYNWWQVPPMRYWPCGSFGPQDDLWGCALADGLAIWRLHRRGLHSLADLHRYMMPWHCIVCCSGYVSGGSDGPSTRAFGLSEVLRNRFEEDEEPLQSIEPDEYIEFPEPQLNEELPERISILRGYLDSTEPIGADLIHKLFGDSPLAKVVLCGNPEKEY